MRQRTCNDLHVRGPQEMTDQYLIVSLFYLLEKYNQRTIGPRSE